jgi:signal transduction histidine kinase/ActR/RegA family two-component response regulator
VLALMGLVTLAIVARRIPDRWIPVSSVAILWCPALCTAIAMYSTSEEINAVLFTLQIAAAGVLLHTRLVFGTLMTILAVAIALVVRADGQYMGVYISVLVIAVTLTLLIHVLMRNALLRAEQLRDIADETARELTARLAELQRSQEERAKLQDQLLHSQRMEAVGTLAAGIAHDMNNVLASISSLGSLLHTEVRDDELREDVDRIIAQTERGAALTRSLLAFSRRGQYRKRPIVLWEVVRELLPMLERTLPKSIEIRADLPAEHVSVEADPTHLEQVLVNLALNAKDAMGGTGVLWIRGDVVAGNRARLRVTDTGVGMDDATRMRAFEPFFTTKALGKGTGLGLSTVWGIVHAHDGSIDVESRPGHGTTFTIELPTSQAIAMVKPRLQTCDERSTDLVGTVLVVDDEEAVRSTSKRLLERMGLCVVTAENGFDALEKYDAFSVSIRLVVLDMGMPGMGGAECFRRLREKTGVPILIATGYAVEEEAQAMVAQGAAILEKPFTAAQLRKEVMRILAAARKAALRNPDPYQQPLDDGGRAHFVD